MTTASGSKPAAHNTMPDEQQKKANRRLGLILASVVAVFFVGFVLRMVFLGH